MFEIILERESEPPVLRLTGNLVLGTPAESLRAAVHQLVANGRAFVIVDVSAITAIDSTGLTALVTAHDKVQRAGGRLVLVQPSMRLRTALDRTRLISMFQVAEDEAAAVHVLRDLRDT
jgi:anti-sigma B factor antagonist